MPVHHFKVDCNHIVVELNYYDADANDADRISQRFPFRLTRWSKFVCGLINDYDG